VILYEVGDELLIWMLLSKCKFRCLRYVNSLDEQTLIERKPNSVGDEDSLNEFVIAKRIFMQFVSMMDLLS